MFPQKPKKEDAYIQVLRRVKATLDSGQGMSPNEFKALLIQLEIKTFPYVTWDNIFDEKWATTGWDNKRHMTLEAYLRLMGYEELRHSLEESKRARKEAKWAICISVVAIIVQIIFR